jgi:hypothetical protein
VPLRVNGLEAKEGVEPATLGVKGVLLTVFVLEVPKVGTTGLEAPLCLSCGGIALPLLVLKGAPFCGARIMALPSRNCRGLRCGLDGRDGVPGFAC